MFKKYIITISLVILVSNNLFAQCNMLIANLPDTIQACKNTNIQLNPTMVASGSPVYIDTFWTPTTGLSDPNIINPVVNIGTASTNYVLTVQAVTPTNLITNGDFSLGNTVFTSAYIPGTGGSYGLLSLEGQYAVTTNPNAVHNNFANFGDHTTGTGSMMVVNGSSSSNTSIWCQTIAVSPNTWYDFSAWGATCVGSNPAILQFSINTALIGTPLSLPLTTGVWTQFHATWFSGTATSIDICINDQQIATSGNDFAIDDIAFKQICTMTDSVYFKVINLTPTIQPELHLGCDEDTVKFYAQNGFGNNATGYSWQFGDGSVSNQKNPTHIYSSQGIYNVKLITSRSGCKDSTTYLIDLTHNFKTQFDCFASVCVGQQLNLINQSTVLNTSIKDSSINWGDGTISNTLNHPYSKAGIYTITFIQTDIIGCKDSFSKTIIVADGPIVSFTTNNDNICVGQPINFIDSTQFCDNFTWDFNDGAILKDVHNPTHVYTAPGVYQVNLVGENKICLSSSVPAVKNITVNAYPSVNLGMDTSICVGLTGLILLSNTIPAFGTYLWNTGETTPSLVINSPGYYWLKVSNGDCATTDSVWVKNDCYLNIPNSFTPNGDGINDYFLPREILSSGLVAFKMNIYNRWGENIYSTTKTSGRGWDGKYNSVIQNMGVYIYAIDAVFENGLRKSFQGNVTLLK